MKDVVLKIFSKIMNSKDISEENIGLVEECLKVV